MNKLDERRKYTSSIITKNKFTDKPAALFGLLVIGSFVMLHFWLYSEVPQMGGMIKDIVRSVTLNNIVHNYVIPVSSGFAAYCVAMLGLALIPEALIHLSYILMIVSGVVAAVVTSSIFCVIPSVLALLSYVFYFRSIKRAACVIQAVSQIYLRNNIAVFLYTVMTFTTIGSFVVMEGIMAKFTKEGQISETVTSVYGLYVLFFVIAVQYMGDVYFSRIVFKYMVKKADGSRTSVIASAMKRTVMSFGTIVIASVVSFIVLVIRMLMREQINRNREERSSAVVIMKMILLFLASILLYMLEVAVDIVNSYVLVHNAIYGENYKESMKEAWEIVKARGTLYFVSSMMVSIVISMLSSMALVAVRYTVLANKDVLTTEYALPAVLCFLAFYITLTATLSGFLVLEFVMRKDKQLVEVVFPGMLSKLSSLGYAV